MTQPGATAGGSASSRPPRLRGVPIGLRVRRFARAVVWDARWFWWAVLWPVTCLAVAVCGFGGGADAISGAGLFVNLAGAYSVVHGIGERRRTFGLPGVRHRAAGWLRRVWRSLFPGKPQVVTAQGAVSLSGAGTATARGMVWPNSLSKRVQVLYEEVLYLHGQLAKVESSMRTEADARRQADLDERAARETAILEQRRQLAELMTGSLDEERVGVWFVVLGSTLGAFPTLIASHIGAIRAILPWCR